ncbi:HAD-IIA family hydrolase [Pseudovibrio sp. SPO723]|uniref:HAD-IIA family hydrolase n=1 Tax=Nesiotobacter zosterae TaxID=392721 RepID=UPI0029C5131E|nr:HAD-IIA family hydrolase [Pseudovibrio sp. SPO723]MDX5592174.1 HAD-IIA family hydrolase [Pseudovibrio sp. SPO723]
MKPETAFERYEEIRSRLPNATGSGSATPINGLQELMDHIDLFVFDAFGVLNVGSTAISGARERIDQLRRVGKHVIVLTNAASHPLQGAVQKFERLGFDFSKDEIISSRLVCESHLEQAEGIGLWGVIAPDGFASSELSLPNIHLKSERSDYDRVDGFLFLSADNWGTKDQQRLHESLRKSPRPLVVANPDLVAPRETGLSLEPGFFGHALQDAFDIPTRYYGKPFANVFEAVESRFPTVERSRIAMMGDTLHTDVLGAKAKGWKAVLVTGHGLYAGLDIHALMEKSGIWPDWMTHSI